MCWWKPLYTLVNQKCGAVQSFLNYLKMDNSKGDCINAELRSTSYPLATRYAPANFARLAVLNASFASLAFVKYRGAQIALWLKGRQCSLVLDIGEDVDMQCSYVLGYAKWWEQSVLLSYRRCQRVVIGIGRMSCAISSTILLYYQYTDIIRMWSIGDLPIWK